MGRNFVVFRELIEECPIDMQESILLSIDLVLSRHPITSKVSTDDNDLSLSALNQDEIRRHTKIKDLPDFPHPTWAKIEAKIKIHSKNGLSEPFLISSLLHMIDAQFRYNADEQEAQRGLRNTQIALESMAEDKAKDSPENAEMWDHLMEPFEGWLSEGERELGKEKQQYEIWKKIAEARLGMHRIYGNWQDCIIYRLTDEED